MAISQKQRDAAAGPGQQAHGMDRLARLFNRYRTHGDVEALGKVFDELAPRLLSIALHICGNPVDAEDVLQQTFLLAMDKSDAFDSGQRLEPWFAGLLRNVARNAMRRASRRRTEALPELASSCDGPRTAAERKEIVAALREQVSALPPEQRQALLLQLEHGLAPAEIADVLQVAPGTVRMRLMRGLRALERRLPKCLAVLALGSRGLAAVRRDVLRAAAKQAAASTAVTAIGGALVLEKAIAVVCVAVIVALAFLWPETNAVSTSIEPGRTEAVTRTATSDSSEMPRERPGSTATERVETAPATLVVRVRAIPAKPSVDLPIRGTTIQVWPGDSPVAPFDSRLEAQRTNGFGEARFSGLAPGRWQLLAAADPEAHAREVVLAPGQLTRIDLVRRVAGVATGRVVDPGGSPLPGAEIWLMRNGSLMVYGRDQLHEPADIRMRCAAVTDVGGRFSVAYATDETKLAARRSGYAASFAQSTRTQGIDELTLVLGRRAGALRGTVRDSAGHGVLNASVVLRPADRGGRRRADGTALMARLPVVTHTHADGRFAFDGLAPAGYQLFADATGCMPTWRDVDVVAGERADIELCLKGGITVTGVVTNADGTAAPGLHIAAVSSLDSPGHINEHGTRTDGSYFMPWIPARAFAVKLSRYGTLLATREFPAPEPGVLRCDFVLQDLASLRGRVVDARGRGMPAWYVSAIDASGVHRATSRTKTSGHFTLRYLQGTTFRLVAYPADGDRDRPPVERTGVSPSGGEIELEVPESAVPRGVVSGRIIDSGGNAVADAEVALKRAGDSSKLHFTRSRPDGTFRVAGVSAGKFEVVVTALWWRERVIGQFQLAHAARQRLGAITVPPPAVLRIEVAHENGSPWTAGFPWFRVLDAEGKRVEARPDPIADRLQYRLEPGHYRVEPAGVDLFGSAQDVELESGRVRTLRFALGLGRSRQLLFNGDGHERIRKRDVWLHVELRRDDGHIVLRTDIQPLWSVAGYYYWSLRHTFRYRGRYRVDGRSDSGLHYSARFEVGDDLEEPTRIDIAAVR